MHFVVVLCTFQLYTHAVPAHDEPATCACAGTHSTGAAVLDAHGIHVRQERHGCGDQRNREGILHVVCDHIPALGRQRHTATVHGANGVRAIHAGADVLSGCQNQRDGLGCIQRGVRGRRAADMWAGDTA